MYHWGRLNFHMAIDEALTRSDDTELGSWYRQFVRDLLHQDAPVTMLAKDVLECARKESDAERQRRHRDLLKVKTSHDMSQQVTTSHDVVTVTDSDCIDSSSTLKVPKRNTVPARELKADERKARIAEMKCKLTSRYPEFPATWENWESSRRKNHKPLTETAAEGQLSKLLGMTRPIQALQDSINGDWQGIFDPDERSGGRTTVSRPNQFKNQFDHASEFGDWVRNGGNK